jgi:hypothetical protein
MLSRLQGSGALQHTVNMSADGTRVDEMGG